MSNIKSFCCAFSSELILSRSSSFLAYISFVMKLISFASVLYGSQRDWNYAALLWRMRHTFHKFVVEFLAHPASRFQILCEVIVISVFSPPEQKFLSSAEPLEQHSRKNRSGLQLDFTGGIHDKVHRTPNLSYMHRQVFAKLYGIQG